MIRDIVKDEEFLKIPSVNATIKDKQVAVDLLDTLEHNSENCVGLAANMIGHSLNIIAVNIHQTLVIMYNPVIVEKHDPYETEEGCLSLEGVRKTTRYKSIVVEYEDHKFKNYYLVLRCRLEFAELIPDKKIKNTAVALKE